MSEEYDFYDWLEDQAREFNEQQRIDEYIEQLVCAIEQLEKALDKACEELARINNAFERRIITTSSYWREWALEEVQEDE